MATGRTSTFCPPKSSSSCDITLAYIGGLLHVPRASSVARAPAIWTHKKQRWQHGEKIIILHRAVATARLRSSRASRPANHTKLDCWSRHATCYFLTHPHCKFPPMCLFNVRALHPLHRTHPTSSRKGATCHLLCLYVSDAAINDVNLCAIYTSCEHPHVIIAPFSTQT